MGERRRSREFALQVLYSIDASGVSIEHALSCFWLTNSDEPAEVRLFTEEIVRGVMGKQGDIDSVISSSSTNWKLPRMSVVDRNVLRIAVFELCWRPDIPAKVTLNEAIEVAKQYGTEESGSFVNGILDKVAKDIKKE